MFTENTHAVTIRESVRAIIVDGSLRILLSRVTSLGKTNNKQLWVTLGGRIQKGEDLKQALERELSEELGAINYVIGPKVWFGDERVNWNGKLVRLIEHFFLVSVPPGEYRFLGVDQAEVASTYELKWWTANKIAASADRFVPCGLANLLGDLPHARDAECIRVQLEQAD